MHSTLGPPPTITIVSTHTCDRFPPDESGYVREIPGGPAHYIAEALDRLGVSHRLVTGDVALVTVLPGPDGEAYIIPPLPCIDLPPRFDSPATILSPISREIDPVDVPPSDGLLVVDLQGFVRVPGRPSTELETIDLTALLARASVVKASEAEIAHLDKPSLRALAGVTLVTTYGRKGVVLRTAGQRYSVAADPVETPHTIGAGDSFLASFVTYLLQSDPPLRAAERAARFTEEMLRERARRLV